MSRPRESETLQLSSGNTIGLAHYGDLNGPVVFYFHGMSSSRLEGAWWAKSAEAVGAHIIALDLPGVGLSSPQPNRKLLDWPLVVSEIAQQLGVGQFYVLGTVAGGPYAFACAKVLSPDKLKGVGAVASGWPGPPTMGNRVKRFLKAWVCRRVYEHGFIPAAKDPDPTVFQKLLIDGISEQNETDKAIFENVEFSTYQVDAERESHRQGIQGVVDELKIYREDWGFDLESISFEAVTLWCGSEDGRGSIDNSRKMASQISEAKLVEFEGDTHYSVLATRGQQILTGLLFGDEKSDSKLFH